MLSDYVKDADGTTYFYRRVSSRLERRPIWSSVWQEVTGAIFLLMTPDELRHVAGVLEGADND